MINDKNQIINTLKQLKLKYEKDGLIIVGLFGSYARNKQTTFSDIDIAYKLDYDKFSLKDTGGFSKLLRIDAIRNEIQDIFKQPIDFVSDSNKRIIKDLIYA